MLPVLPSIAISTVYTDRASVLRKIRQSPVVVRDRTEEIAVMVPIDQWNAIARELHQWRQLAEAKNAERTTTGWTDHFDLKKTLEARSAHALGD